MDLSPGWAAAAELRRREEELRSAELRVENEKLRRELARAGEVGDSLEQKQQQAEDRMLELEQERRMLRERIACLSAVGASPLLAQASSSSVETVPLGAGCGASPSRLPGEKSSSKAVSALPIAARTVASTSGSEDPEEAARRQLEEVNRKLRMELEEATQRQEQLLRRERFHSDMTSSDVGHSSSTRVAEAAQAAAEAAWQAQSAEAVRAAQAAAAEAREEERNLENAALEAERRRVEELRQQTESQARMMGSLDEQNQALERRLQEAEAHAKALAEEMRQLQASGGAAAGQAAWAAGSEDLRAVDGGPGDAEPAATALGVTGSEEAVSQSLADEEPVAEEALDLADLEEAW